MLTYNLSEKGSRVVLFLFITIIALYAWHNRFLQDDAFISFRYAENLVNGKGLVFNEKT